jgi:hypothetical protein
MNESAPVRRRVIRRLVGQARFPEFILRGARNTLTTNGLSGSRRLIVAISRGADGAQPVHRLVLPLG